MIELLKQRIKTVGGQIRDAVETIPQEERNSRLDTCNSCEFLIAFTGQCKKCGCFMFAKTYLAEAECPIGKWKKHSSIEENSKDSN